MKPLCGEFGDDCGKLKPACKEFGDDCGEIEPNCREIRKLRGTQGRLREIQPGLQEIQPILCGIRTILRGTRKSHRFPVNLQKPYAATIKKQEAHVQPPTFSFTEPIERLPTQLLRR
jgi:hypothetical protein